MNPQKPSKPSFDPTGIIELHSIFSTIQGEGIFAGHPATFVRLAGCNIQCPMCDTEYTDGMQKVRPQYVVDEVEKMTAPNRLVVITGGEPLRQEINPLVTTLIAAGFTVQIETNGTLPLSSGLVDSFVNFSTRLFLVCSPKARVNPHLLPYISAYKYVLDRREIDPRDGLPTRVLGWKQGKISRPHPGFTGPVYVQPADTKDEAENLKNEHMTVKAALEHGYVVCLQLHKILNME